MTNELKRRPVAISSGIPFATVLLAVTLTGCGANAGGAGSDTGTETPEHSAAVLESEPVSGRGPTGSPGVDFPIPDGAQSVVIDFECDGGGQYSVEIGDSMALDLALLRGVCDGAQELAWPVVEQMEPTLSVTVPEDVDWVATPTFSTTPFVSDPALTDDCRTFGDAYSALMNADQGYTLYDAFDAAEWNARVDGAVAQLTDLAATAHPALADPVARLQAAASDPDRTVGEVLTTDTYAMIGEVSQACDANQTPLKLSGEFGG